MPDPVARDTVTLGSVATFVRDDGRRMTYRILEADPGAWSISYVSPVARALIGEAPGDRVVFGDREIEVLTANSTGSLAASSDFPFWPNEPAAQAFLLPWPAAGTGNGRGKAPTSDQPSPPASGGARPPAGASSLDCALS